MNSQQKYLQEYFQQNTDRKWKIQNYIANLSREQLFNLYIAKKINHKDLTVRRYLLEAKEKSDEKQNPQQPQTN